LSIAALAYCGPPCPVAMDQSEAPLAEKACRLLTWSAM
jgi:hypothetical protein